MTRETILRISEHGALFSASTTDFGGQDPFRTAVSIVDRMDVDVTTWSPVQRWHADIERILAHQDEGGHQGTVYGDTQGFSGPWRSRALDIPHALPITHMLRGSSLFRSRIDAGFTFHTPSGEYIIAFHPQVPLTERDQRIAEMEKTFRRFEALPEEWDSYGGATISPTAISEARRVLTATINLNLPEPWTAPGGDGGIGIQWDLERIELYIDIVPGEVTTYLLTPLAEDGSEIADAQIDAELTTDNLSEVLNKLAESTSRSIKLT